MSTSAHRLVIHTFSFFTRRSVLDIKEKQEPRGKNQDISRNIILILLQIPTLLARRGGYFVLGT